MCGGWEARQEVGKGKARLHLRVRNFLEADNVLQIWQIGQITTFAEPSSVGKPSNMCLRKCPFYHLPHFSSNYRESESRWLRSLFESQVLEKLVGWGEIGGGPVAFRRHFGRGGEMFLNVLHLFAGKALPEHLNLERKNDFRRSF